MKFALLALLCVVGWIFLTRIWRKPDYPYYSRDTLLSDGELAFFRTLEQAVAPAHLIAPKVRLGDIVGCSERDWQRGYGPRISAKHVDFVIADRATTRILAAIELDDASHDRPERRSRDAFLNHTLDAAGIPLIRVPAAAQYSLPDLHRALQEALTP